jgi:hypothetical protein
VHRKAQPIFHWPLPTVNGVLVQAPWDCFGPSSTTNGPEPDVVAGAEVLLLGWVVGVWLAGTVVPVAPPLDGEVPPEPDSAGKGRWDPVPVASLEVAELEPPVGKQLPRSIPITSVPTAAVTNCQVLHETRSLIFSSPGASASRGVSCPQLPTD